MTGGVYNFNYAKASFRGAQFAVFDAEVLFGRRNVLHEYPLRDEPFAEDLGKKAREYTINAFVIGKDLRAARDALMKAIEDQDTAGTLVHPTLGSLSVIPKDCRVKFNNKEGGIEYFTLTFVEAGENKYPSSGINTSFLSGLFSSQAITSFSNFFASAFNVLNVSDFLHTNALSNLTGNSSNNTSGSGGSDFVASVRNILKLNSFGSDNSNFTNISDALTKFQTTATTDLYTPTVLAQKISNITTQMSNVYLEQPTVTAAAEKTFLSRVKPSHPELQALNAQRKLQLYGLDFLEVPLTTSSRIQEAENQYQLINLIINISLAEMIRITSIMDFASRQDAIGIRNDLDSYISPQLLRLADAGEDIPYLALNKARAAMIKDINARAATLKNKLYIPTAYAIPAIVFAYDNYEDATKDEEIITRNRIRNPVFIPPYSTLEILV